MEKKMEKSIMGLPRVSGLDFPDTQGYSIMLFTAYLGEVIIGSNSESYILAQSIILSYYIVSYDILLYTIIKYSIILYTML